jgi:hypothetical protein
LAKERRGEESWPERKRWPKSSCCFPNIEDRKGGQEKHIYAYCVYICSLFLYMQAIAAAIYHKTSSNSSSSGRGLRNMLNIIRSRTWSIKAL